VNGDDDTASLAVIGAAIDRLSASAVAVLAKMSSTFPFGTSSNMGSVYLLYGKTVKGAGSLAPFLFFTVTS
jgi:hypothetical protein